MQNRHNPVTPSPLSQSTSAVHLKSSSTEIHIPRKLSKRRTPTAEAVFKQKPEPETVDRKIHSEPPTPLERVQMPPNDYNPTSLAQEDVGRASPVKFRVLPTAGRLKRRRRGSMLNRLARSLAYSGSPWMNGALETNIGRILQSRSQRISQRSWATSQL